MLARGVSTTTGQMLTILISDRCFQPGSFLESKSGPLLASAEADTGRYVDVPLLMLPIVPPFASGLRGLTVRERDDEEFRLTHVMAGVGCCRASVAKSEMSA
jgi:hypothetical protein